jgi:hypothetical protein
LGLVQAEPDAVEKGREVKVEGIRFIWDAELENTSQQFGGLTLDYVKTFFGPKFTVGFENATC